MPLIMRGVQKCAGALLRARQAYLNFKYRRFVKGHGQIVVRTSAVKLAMDIADGGRLQLNGNLLLQSDLGESGVCVIRVCKGASFIVDGDLLLGPNTTIIVERDAILVVGGQKASSASGFTGSSRVMVKKDVRIGADCIIAWDVFITDCDWHELHGTPATSATWIGERVWIAHGVSILKGAIIGNGCVVAAHSVCAKHSYPGHCLIAGAPARVVRPDISWSREMSCG